MNDLGQFIGKVPEKMFMMYFALQQANYKPNIEINNDFFTNYDMRYLISFDSLVKAKTTFFIVMKEPIADYFAFEVYVKHPSGKTSWCDIYSLNDDFYMELGRKDFGFGKFEKKFQIYFSMNDRLEIKKNYEDFKEKYRGALSASDLGLL